MVTLDILAIMITVFITLMFVIAGILAIFAAAIAIAAGTIVGAPAALEMETEVTEFCEGCQKVLEVSSNVIGTSSAAAGGVLAAKLGVDVFGQLFEGNPNALINLGQATVNGLGTMANGTLQYIEQKVSSKMLAGKTDIPRMPGLNRIPRLAAGAEHQLPETLKPFFRTVFGGKGTIDVFTGGPSISTAATK